MTKKLSLNKSNEDLPFKNIKLVYSFHLRDTRLENEFEVFIYSLRNTLTMTTKLISSFLSGRTSIHSHSKLRENLNKTGDWPILVELIHLACENWIDELTDRRDAATHYVALTATSSLSSEFQKPNDHKTQQNTVSIPKKPLKYVSLWWDHIPTIGGTSTTSSTITNSDGDSIEKIEKYELFDNEENLLVTRECKPPDIPESIDGIKYCNDLMQNFASYFIEISSELIAKLI